MSRVFFAGELEGVATFWRIFRQDGCTLGFTSHDRDLWFDGLLHRAAPGMVPSAVRLNAGLQADDAEVQGALSHDAIRSADLAAGRYDGARFAIGVVDWETMEAATLYHGSTGAISLEEGGFTAELQSAKASLDVDLILRTSPTCRAQFCGPGCSLDPAMFTHEIVAAEIDAEAGLITLDSADIAQSLRDGWLRWIDGPHGGITMQVMNVSGVTLTLDQPLSASLASGARAIAREGCDHTVATCATRFGNAANFQGEPFLPGNDLLTRYPPAGG